MKKMLILGANSDIAKATAFYLIQDGWDIILTGRDISVLNNLAQDLKKSVEIKTNIECHELDVNDFDKFVELWKTLLIMPEAVLCAVGYLGDNVLAPYSKEETEKILSTNFTALVPILNIIATDFEKRKAGLIIGISSVAGERGRASNYTYGAAKAGFSAYLSGLRNRLTKSKVQVITVKPGLVATRMTQHRKLPPFITATAKDIAQDIMKAIYKKYDVIYSKWFWQIIMFVVRIIPENIFKRLNF